MMTPEMFVWTGDGDLWPIPEEHAAIFNRYRDATAVIQPEDAPIIQRYPSMPLVYEPQFFGDPLPLYPLIDDVTEEDGRLSYRCYAIPGTFTVEAGGFIRQDMTATLSPNLPRREVAA